MLILYTCFSFFCNRLKDVITFLEVKYPIVKKKLKSIIFIFLFLTSVKLTYLNNQKLAMLAIMLRV